MFPKLLFVFILFAGVAFYWWRRRALPPAVLLFVASVFLSRVYWKIAGTTVRFEQMTALILFAFFLLDLLRKKMSFRLHWPAGLVLALFPLMLLPSLLVSPAPWLSLKKSLLYLPYFLAFLALVHYLAEAEKMREAWHAFYAFGAAAVFLSVTGFYLLFFGINIGMVRMDFGSLWLRGTMVVPNIMGSTAMIVFLAALMRLTGREPGRNKENALDMAVLAVSFGAAIMSYTRTAWLGILGGIVLVICIRWRRLSLKTAAAILLLLAGSGIFVLFTTSEARWLKVEEKNGVSMGEYGEAAEDARIGYQIGKRKWRSDADEVAYQRYLLERKSGGINYGKKLRELFGNDGRDQWRLRIAGIALKHWRRSPIIGRGTDSLQLLKWKKKPKNIYSFYIPLTSLAILHDWGMIALLIYGVFLLAVFLRLLKLTRTKTDDLRRESAAVLLVVFITTTLIYQVSTTMQLSIFWCLWAFYAAAVSLKPSPDDELRVRREAMP